MLTGQTIDRKLYDHVNSYTGESGSDGVVRVAAANLNAVHVRLEQVPPVTVSNVVSAERLSLKAPSVAPRTAMRVMANTSHSGTAIGIMGSVDPRPDTDKGSALVEAIIDAIGVDTMPQYRALADAWDDATDDVQKGERLEIEDRLLLPDSFFIHDRQSMIILRVIDTAGYRVGDLDLILTGESDSPERLPRGFLSDRQWNDTSKALTFLLNHDVMVGAPPVEDEDREYRPALKGIKRLGMKVQPRPTDGFVHYLPCGLQAIPSALTRFVKPNQTTIVDIELQRIVRSGVFALVQGRTKPSFKWIKPGGIVE